MRPSCSRLGQDGNLTCSNPACHAAVSVLDRPQRRLMAAILGLFLALTAGFALTSR